MSGREASLGLAPSPLRPGTVRRPPDTCRLTFAEVLTLRVVKGLRTTGYSMWTIRRIATMAEREFGCRAPLATQRFRAEGALLFLRIDEATHYMYAQEAAETGRDPVAAMVWQSVFRDVLDRALFRDVDWQDGLPVCWWPLGRDAGIAVDPRVVRGLPHVAGPRIRTATIATTARQAEWDEVAVAAACSLTPRQVHNAVRFETEWPVPSEVAPAAGGQDHR